MTQVFVSTTTTSLAWLGTQDRDEHLAAVNRKGHVERRRIFTNPGRIMPISRASNYAGTGSFTSKIAILLARKLFIIVKMGGLRRRVETGFVDWVLDQRQHDFPNLGRAAHLFHECSPRSFDWPGESMRLPILPIHDDTAAAIRADPSP